MMMNRCLWIAVATAVALLVAVDHVHAFTANSLPITTTARHNGLRTALPKHSVGTSWKVLCATTTVVLEDDRSETTKPYTIQILMSDTGGGHRASANALRDAFDKMYPGQIECDIVDIYTDYGPFWPYNDYVGMYKFMAKYPWTWKLFYEFGSTPFGEQLNEILLGTFCFEPFAKCMARSSSSSSSSSNGKRADMVVSVHPLTQAIPLQILAYLDSKGKTRDYKSRTETPFVTVVTDLGSAHPTWFHPAVDKCFVPSDALYQVARKRGLQPNQIVQHGLPIRQGFWNEYNAKNTKNKKDKVTLRKELGIQTDLPTVLVVGGGDGMGGLVDISKALGQQLGNDDNKKKYQMVVVCGNNADAKQALTKGIQWPSSVTVNVQGFVNNMDEWMKASDALVTKAGPGTIAEASICGLPCMMFSYLPGQEEGNIPFVEDSGFGKYSGDPAVIAKTVSSWLADEQKLTSMQQAALNASRPHATLDIAKDIAEMLFEKKNKQQKQQKTTSLQTKTPVQEKEYYFISQ